MEKIEDEHDDICGGRGKSVYEADHWRLSPFLEVKPSKTEDMVNRPLHYTSDPSGIECIQITRYRNFNIGNAIKYLWRAGLKDSDIQDLEKAIWYIQDEIKRLRGNA